jgi:hypothetical protein
MPMAAGRLAAVVADPGAVLVSASPPRPAQPVCRPAHRPPDHGGEQPPDLAAGRRRPGRCRSCRRCRCAGVAPRRCACPASSRPSHPAPALPAGRRGAPPGSREGRHGPCRGPTPPGRAGAACHRGCDPRHARPGSQQVFLGRSGSSRSTNALAAAGSTRVNRPAMRPSSSSRTSCQRQRVCCAFGHRVISDSGVQHRMISGGCRGVPTRP